MDLIEPAWEIVVKEQHVVILLQHMRSSLWRQSVGISRKLPFYPIKQAEVNHFRLLKPSYVLFLIINCLFLQQNLFYVTALTGNDINFILDSEQHTQY